MRDDIRAPVSRLGRLADRVAGLSGWRRLLAAALTGAAMTAGHAPLSIPWLWFLSLPVLIWLTDGAARPRQAAWIGWAAAFGYFVTGLFWVGHAFMVEAEQFAWLMPFAVTLLPAGLALFWAAAFWLAARRWRAGSPGRVLALTAWLVIAEYLRSKVLTGFPWALPAYIWSETPLMQAASWAGPHGLNILTLLAAGFLLTGLASGRTGGRVASGLAAAGVAALWIAGAARIPDETAYAPDAPVLRIVQPNAAQHLKWEPDHAPVFYRRLLEATRAPSDPAIGAPDLVIWPETAVTFLPAEMPEERARIAATAGGVPVILGALHRQPGPAGLDWSNALMVLSPDAEIAARYDKHHLVPFGEYLPFKRLFSAIGLRQLAIRGGFAPGPGPQAISVPGLPDFSPLICYEAIFPDEVQPAQRTGWMLQITNDAWFGSFGGPQQHLAQARFRAVEQGLPLVRAANTGISAVIDPHGRIIASLGLGAEGHIDSRLPVPNSASLYSITGDWVAIAMAFLLLLAANLGQNQRMRQ